MNLSDLLKLFGTELHWMVWLGLLFLTSVIVDPRWPARVSATPTVRFSPASMSWSCRLRRAATGQGSAEASSCCRSGEAVHAEVMVYSGVRSDLNLVRALALGASGPSLWGLSAADADGTALVSHRYCVTSYEKRGSSHFMFTQRTIRRQRRPADEPRERALNNARSCPPSIDQDTTLQPISWSVFPHQQRGDNSTTDDSKGFGHGDSPPNRAQGG
jgi:hypothetical protein